MYARLKTIRCYAPQPTDKIPTPETVAKLVWELDIPPSEIIKFIGKVGKDWIIEFPQEELPLKQARELVGDKV